MTYLSCSDWAQDVVLGPPLIKCKLGNRRRLSYFLASPSSWTAWLCHNGGNLGKFAVTQIPTERQGVVCQEQAQETHMCTLICISGTSNVESGPHAASNSCFRTEAATCDQPNLDHASKVGDACQDASKECLPDASCLPLVCPETRLDALRFDCWLHDNQLLVAL